MSASDHVSALLSEIHSDPWLQSRLSMEKLTGFLQICHRMLPVICALPQQAPIYLEDLPMQLSPSFTGFIGNCVALDDDMVARCWKAFRVSIFNTILVEDTLFQDLLRLHGPTANIRAISLEPPSRTCLSCGLALKRKNHGTEARLYTITQGVLPLSVYYARCGTCKISYYPTYSVSDPTSGEAERVYYNDSSEYVEVTDTCWMDKGMLGFIETMFVQTISASKIATTYNLAIATIDGIEGSHSYLNNLLDPAMIYDAYFMYTLLRHHQERSETTLRMPHNGAQKDRLKAAMEQRNKLMVGTGQEMWGHACSLCMKIYRGQDDGKLYRVRCGGTDGVTVTRFCCSVAENCHEDLASSKDRFCLSHAYKGKECFVQTCRAPARAGRHSCLEPSHVQRETEQRQKAQKSYQELSKRAYRAGISRTVLAGQDSEHCIGSTPRQPIVPPGIPPSSTASPDPNPSSEPATASQDPLPELRGGLARKKTHNEQLFVMSCGVITARATFLQAEGVASVKDFLKVIFPPEFPGAMPQLMFFDKACQLVKHLDAQDDYYFEKCGMYVDVFHASAKHHESDDFCNKHCNPALFPEMRTEDGERWEFNTSICEQENNWFGAFQPLVKEMPAWRFSFFLDENIMVRNRLTVAALEKAGRHPHIIPDAELRRAH